MEAKASSHVSPPPKCKAFQRYLSTFYSATPTLDLIPQFQHVSTYRELLRLSHVPCLGRHVRNLQVLTEKVALETIRLSLPLMSSLKAMFLTLPNDDVPLFELTTATSNKD